MPDTDPLATLLLRVDGEAGGNRRLTTGWAADIAARLRERGVTFTQPQPDAACEFDPYYCRTHDATRHSVIDERCSDYVEPSLIQPQPDADRCPDCTANGVLCAVHLRPQLDACRFCGGAHSSYTCPRAATMPQPDATSCCDNMEGHYHQGSRWVPKRQPQSDAGLRECKCSPLDGHDKHCEAGLDDQWPAIAHAVATEAAARKPAQRTQEAHMPTITCPICGATLGNGEALIFEPNSIISDLPVLRHVKEVAFDDFSSGSPDYRERLTARPSCGARIDVI